jgi:hemolysin activation/secretion protein
VTRILLRLGLAAATSLSLWISASAQTVPVPAPSQVQPPTIAPPTGGGHIAIPQVPAGAQIPPEAKKLKFKLIGFVVKDEFPELVEQRQELETPLDGKTITVAQVFEFADQLQQIYAKAGYPLARVILLPQEFEGAAKIKLRVIDGYVERFNLDALPWQVQHRVGSVLGPLMNKTHLQQSELERQLLIAGETPGLVLNATFAPGKQIGGSVLVLTGRYRAVSLSVYGDNDMPVVFGTGQGVVTASANSWLGLGEQLTVTTAGLPDKDFVTEFPTRRYMGGTFSVPLGIDGLKFQTGGTDGITTPRVDPSVGTKGVYNEGYVELAYELLKRRDYEMTFTEMLDAENETIDTLALQPVMPLSEDRIRPLRTGVNGIWRLREYGTTITYNATWSRGLDALGARTSATAGVPLTECTTVTSALPLSRQCADAVFNKLAGQVEIDQALPQDFFDNIYGAGQDSFHRAMLTAEQFDIDGAKMLSGFTAGSLPGDTAWMIRNEFGRNITTQLPLGGIVSGVVWSPYVFVSNGERILEDPTALEIASVHATNYGAGLRYSLVPAFDPVPNTYGFVEWSRRYTNETALNGDRIFVGMLMQY